MYRRLTAIAAASGALLLTLTGCFGDPAGTGADAGGAVKLAANEILAKVSDKAGQSDTFRVKMTMGMRLTQEGITVDTTTESDLAVRLRPAVALRGTVRVKASADETGLSDTRSMQMVFVDGSYYLNTGDPKLTGGKPWGRISLEGLTGMGGADLSKEAQRQSPAEMARILTAAPDVKETGKETVDGVQTTRYEGTIDLRRDLAKLDQGQDMAEAYQELGASTMRISLWVGPDSLPRKQTSQMTLKDGGSMTVTMVYRDYGKPVRISAPPSDQVGELRLPGVPQIPTRT
ncbi:LppX_LprAFG lipoprotein [Thermomonospora amylolytica]|uniref:LppX_LprAFG lipoprotein n=1 Tax=Thermomonospora amylolytica TaxID=1411117 RepID=UPI000E6C6A16|nr:LppX_LprAFG lipoprotein [Thermomonospora amylolytica]